MTLRVTAAGPGATIQDGGRTGYLRFGVTPAGPMDWTAMRSANAALGNEADAAAVEIAAGGLTVVCEEAPVTIAFAGAGFSWTRDGVPLPTAGRVHLHPGAVLRARSGPWGAFTYLAVPGGVDVAPVMGSRSTHTRSGLGGIEGRMLQVDDVLPIAKTDAAPQDDATIDAPWLAQSNEPIAVVLGPQDDYFDAEALSTFTESDFTLTPAADRMAYKFKGAKIAHKEDFNIVSDGVSLGAIQVAGDGQPMILMADRQPTGGYTKIAHVAHVDIGRVAQLRAGETCRFRVIDAETARKATLALEKRVETTASHCKLLRRPPSTETLFACNLIGGVVDALAPEGADGG